MNKIIRIKNKKETFKIIYFDFRDFKKNLIFSNYICL